MKRALLLAVASAAVGCAAGPGPAGAPPRTAQGGPGTDRVLPIPADLAPHIQESIELGRSLYFLDKASAIGTDVLKEKVPDFAKRGVGGWLTMRAADDSDKPIEAFAVTFITRDEPFRTLFRVDVPFQAEPKLRELSPPQLL